MALGLGTLLQIFEEGNSKKFCKKFNPADGNEETLSTSVDPMMLNSIDRRKEPVGLLVEAYTVEKDRVILIRWQQSRNINLLDSLLKAA